MNNIYMAVYVCKSITPTCIVHGYNDVVLGMESGNGFTDITVKGTIGRFRVGNEYLISISEELPLVKEVP